MPQDYKTVKRGASDEFSEKKSRFIGYCRPVSTEDEAINFINAVRGTHRDATHNVYAYIVRENNAMRYSDDGEPAGTAGMPVLDVLRGLELTDTAVVVTRYFGGTLLGTGGLVRAYSKGAKAAVDAAVVVEKIYCGIYSVKCGYTLLGKLQYAISENENYMIKNTVYTDSVELTVCVKAAAMDSFEKMIIDKSGGVIKPELISEEYIDKI